MKTFREMNENLTETQFDRELGDKFLESLAQELVECKNCDMDEFFPLLQQIILYPSQFGEIERDGNWMYNEGAVLFGKVIRKLRGKVNGEKFNF